VTSVYPLVNERASDAGPLYSNICMAEAFQLPCKNVMHLRLKPGCPGFVDLVQAAPALFTLHLAALAVLTFCRCCMASCHLWKWSSLCSLVEPQMWAQTSE
jgi:hypothetical protein